MFHIELIPYTKIKEHSGNVPNRINFMLIIFIQLVTIQNSNKQKKNHVTYSNISIATTSTS
jgi:hypothetical protein